jgi:hypothetical protein
MPDITAARPVSGAPIASAWGGQVHDALEGLQAGTLTITATGVNAASAVVTFPRPYTAPPAVVGTVNVGSAGWFAVCHTITATGFTFLISFRDSATSTVTAPCSWVAMGTPA